jgi:CspA family cold shock protein
VVFQGSRKGSSSMAVGKVKWFNNAKGFGFIVPEDGGEDIFAHYSTIKMDGYRSLKAGQEVTYEVQQGPKGLHAENIGLSDDEPER